MTNDWTCVYSYSRQQAIEDGVLLDLTEHAKKYGFTVPVAITDAAYAETVEWADSDKGLGQSTEGRLHDLLSMAYLCALQNVKSGTDTCFFPLRVVPRGGKGVTPKRVDMKIVIGPGDTAQPVVTLMLSGED